MKRRDLLKIGAAGSVLPMTGCIEDSIEPEWNSGEVAHILPLVSSTAFNIKVSFRQPLKSPPELKVDELLVTGIQQDTRGRFWSFVVGNLEPNRQYILQLISKNQVLCDVWPLATFPDEQANIDQLKLIAFTCAGGPDLPVLPGGRHAFKPVRYRQKLYQQMLERNPDLVISNGDHVYWDYESWRNSPDSELAKMAGNLFMNTFVRRSLWNCMCMELGCLCCITYNHNVQLVTFATKWHLYVYISSNYFCVVTSFANVLC